jgi:hypothetical protein
MAEYGAVELTSEDKTKALSFDYYKSWIGTQYLCWSEYLGSRKVATIPTKHQRRKKYGRFKWITSTLQVLHGK